MTDCPICYDPISAQTNNCTLSCSHAFHLKCMTSWMETSETCPMCRMDFSDKEEPVHGPDYKTMGNIHITEAQIQRIRNEARVSRGIAIREAQESYGYLEHWLEDEDLEHVIESAKIQRVCLICTPLSKDPKWNDVTPECEAYRKFRALFGEEEERNPDLSAKSLRIRHRFSGFYDWHNADWDTNEVVDGYATD